MASKMPTYSIKRDARFNYWLKSIKNISKPSLVLLEVASSLVNVLLVSSLVLVNAGDGGVWRGTGGLCGACTGLQFFGHVSSSLKAPCLTFSANPLLVACGEYLATM